MAATAASSRLAGVLGHARRGVTTMASPAVSSKSRLATLSVQGPDRRGIVAACSDLLSRHNCGIIQSEFTVDRPSSMLFQRIQFDSALCPSKTAAVAEFDKILSRFGILGEIDWRDERKRVAVMVSKYDHCLWELLLRHKAGELNCHLSVVISNHPDLKPVATTFGIPFVQIPITAETKREQEQKQLALLEEYNVDVVVLARYMQVLSDEFLAVYENRIINIHHSFLPAFAGGHAYKQAHQRGVKLIGATAHYATEELDEGPIIAQDVMQVSHRDQASDFVRKGRILERNILARALQAHLENRILVWENKCVVFND